MTVRDVAAITGATALTRETLLDREVTRGYACDLLSWVMAHGAPGMAWITVQTHMNVVAVALLMEMACVIVPERIAVPDDVLARADAEGIAVLGSDKTAYQLSGLLYERGLLGG